MNYAIVSFNMSSYIPIDRLTIQNKFFREVCPSVQIPTTCDLRVTSERVL